MNRSLASAALLVIGVLLIAPFAAAQEQEKDCAAPSELIQDDPKLPLLAARLKQHKAVKIIAIGGSSTAGAAAQSPLQSYPQRLEETLAELFPDVEISVVNKGVPRQTAQEMVDRFANDIIAEDPVLAIWETGTTDAVRVYLFKRFEIMRFWSENGTFNFEDVQKGDRGRLAADVYDCLARRIADAIDYAVQ